MDPSPLEWEGGRLHLIGKSAQSYRRELPKRAVSALGKELPTPFLCSTVSRECRGGQSSQNRRKENRSGEGFRDLILHFR